MSELQNDISNPARLNRARSQNQRPTRREREARSVALGRWGEEIAVRFLEAQNYRVLERNWRCRHGEIDIVAHHNRVLAFVEVKTRSSSNFGHPFEAISRAKLSRMHVLARLWCGEHPEIPARVRLDVIGVLASRGAQPRIEHLIGVHA